MTSDAADQADLTRFLDEARVVRVVAGYFLALDERRFDEADFHDLLAPDARMVRPNGVATVGPADIAASHARSFARFTATQHLLANHHVVVDGDTAAARADLVAIHLWKDRPSDASMLDRSFTAGTVITTALRRAPEGWRIHELQNRPVWRTGHLGDMPQTR